MKEISFIEQLGFTLKDGKNGVFSKSYKNKYTLEIDFEKKKIDFGGKIKLGERTVQNIIKPEDWVVLECVNRLLEKGYQPEDIILEKVYPTGHQTSGRLDILVRKEGKAFLMIECKTWGREFDKAFKKIQKDGGQLFTYFQQDTHADFLMLYTSASESGELSYKNEIIKIEDHYRTAGNVADFYDRWNKLTEQNGIFERWVKPYDFKTKALVKARLKPLTEEDSRFIFHEFLSILRKHSVSDKPNAFNVIFDLFLAKLWDEKKESDEEMEFQWKENKDDPVNFQYRLLDLYRAGMNDFLKKEVLGLSDSDFSAKNDKELEKIKKKVLMLEKIFNIKSVIDEESFEENHRVLKEVVQLLQRYQIRYPRKQKHLSDFFERLLTTGLKQEAGQFFTPPPITRFIVRSIPVKEVLTKFINQKSPELPAVIDYAVGSGHFLTEVMEEYQTVINELKIDHFKTDAKTFVKKWRVAPYDWAAEYIYGVDKDYRLVKTAKVGCYFYGDGLAQVIHGDGLDNFENSKSYRGLLEKNAQKPQFQFVLSNPPYSVSAFKTTLRAVDAKEDFELYKYLSDRSSEIECLFIERTKQLLREGGIAAIILPSSILSNTGIYTKAREILLKHFEFVAITELGSNTFMATGTNTVVLFLRRRKDEVLEKIKTYVADFIRSPKDMAVNGVEKVFSKYVAQVWEGPNFEDYVSLIQGKPNATIQAHEFYGEYQKKVKAKNEAEKLNSILDIEAEKLLYFILAYPQEVVLVKTGEKNVEKNFLGYEFSNRRGHEGMHAIQRGKTVDECTQLFDPEVSDNPTRASTYILEAFEGQKEREIDSSLKNHVLRTSLVDMMTWDRVEFEKNVSLSVKKKVKIESKWELVRIKDISEEIINGSTPSKNDYKFWDKKEINWLTIPDLNSSRLEVSNTENYVTKYALENKKVRIIPINSVLVSCTATIGKIGINSIKLSTNQQINAIVCNKKVLPYYLGNILRIYGKSLADLTSNSGVKHINLQTLNDFKIPLPPLDVQQKIVDEIEALEEKEEKAKDEIERLENSIADVMSPLQAKDQEKLENLALMLKRGKSAKYGQSEIQIIKSGQARGYKSFDFSQKHYIDENFVVDERKLEKGDILINSSGVGTAGRVTLFNLDGNFVVDSHITILRPNQEKVLPDFILQSLAQIGFKSIEAMAMGQSGQIELSLATIQNIKIPLPPLPEQQKIISEIEKIEAKIDVLEKELAQIPAKKEAVLKKYL